MSSDHPVRRPHEFVLVQAGPVHRLGKHLGSLWPLASRRLVRIALLILLTWVPIVILSWCTSYVTGCAGISLWHDPQVHCRLLLALPMLSIADVLITTALATQVAHLFESGIIPVVDHVRFANAKAEVIRLREDPKVEALFGVAGFVISVAMRVYFWSGSESTWERQGAIVTSAGWWYILVSLPVLFFFLLRAAGIFVLWGWFLFRVSRMDLQLTSTHPDRAGGIGFLGWGLACFSPVLLSFSTVMSAGFANEIFHRGETLASLKYHLIVYVVVALFLVHLPLFSYSLKLSRCRFRGLLEISALVWRYDREFDEKWIKQPQEHNTEPLLGSADVQSLADIATVYEHAEQMWLLPLDTKALAVFALAAILPMLPLVGTAIPLQDILSKLGELLV